MRVFCRAWENVYLGMHGMDSRAVLEFSNDNYIDEINKWGKEEVKTLIKFYKLEHKYPTYVKDVLSWKNEGGWYAFKIKDDINLPIEELNNILYKSDYEVFVNDFCEEEIEL